jgi:hypothetical protein
LYRTTKTFLRSFGLSCLEDLPVLPSAFAEDGQLTIGTGWAAVLPDGAQRVSEAVSADMPKGDGA